MGENNFDFGSNVANWVLLLIIICTLAFRSGKVAFAQTEPESDEIVVAKAAQRFVHYGQDYLQFAKAGSSDESEVAMDLSTIAAQTDDYLNAVLTLLSIYDNLSCKEDRARIQPKIKTDLRFYSKNLELFIKEANVDIAHTKMPGVASEGIRMRDDLREVKNVFDSMKLR